MFSDNPNMIPPIHYLVLYHGIEFPTKPYNLGFIRTVNMRDDLMDDLIANIKNENIKKICVNINILCFQSTNPYSLDFDILDAYKDLNDFVVKIPLYNKYYGVRLCLTDYEIVSWSMNCKNNRIYKIDNVQ